VYTRGYMDTQTQTQASLWAVGNAPLCTHICPCPFFEATPPGAASGPPVKTGARVRRFRGCKKTSTGGSVLLTGSLKGPLVDGADKYPELSARAGSWALDKRRLYALCVFRKPAPAFPHHARASIWLFASGPFSALLTLRRMTETRSPPCRAVRCCLPTQMQRRFPGPIPLRPSPLGRL